LRKRFGGIDRVLALHRIDDEQRFDGFEFGVQLADLAHHRFVNREPSRGIDDQHLMVMLARKIERGPGNRRRRLPGIGGKEIGADLLGQQAKLFDSGRAVDIAAHQQHLLALLLLEPFCKFAGGGGLARALQARHQDHRGRLCGKIQRIGLLAHQRNKLTMHHAHDRLSRGQAADYFRTQRLLAYAADEFPDHGQRDVGFQERHAHFSERLLDVGLGDSGLAAQRFDDARQAVGQVIEHRLEWCRLS